MIIIAVLNLTRYKKKYKTTPINPSFYTISITSVHLSSLTGHSPIPDAALSICSRFFRYIGQTCPSKYPRGSGGLYTLELSGGQNIKRQTFFTWLKQKTLYLDILIKKKDTFSSFCTHHMEFP